MKLPMLLPSESGSNEYDIEHLFAESMQDAEGRQPELGYMAFVKFVDKKPEPRPELIKRQECKVKYTFKVRASLHIEMESGAVLQDKC